MGKRIIIFSAVFVLAALAFAALGERLKPPLRREIIESGPAKKNKACRIGEEIIYDVRLGGVCLGEAKFKNVALAELNRSKVNLVTFETRLVRFIDREEIYSDLDTFLPVRVERDISMWPKKEKIIEEYDQKNFTLVIKKLIGNKESQVIIKRKSPISNAILLPYSIRDISGLDIGWSLSVTLPTQEFQIRLVSREEVATPAGPFDAYRFESVPKKFEIWISADKRRIPVKIKGTNKLGYTLVIKKYLFKD